MKIGRPRIDIAIGSRFERWIVVGLDRIDARRGVFWKCRCDCGAEGSISGGSLRRGLTASCGCKRARHGMTQTPEWQAWHGMIQRCTNPHHQSWKYYGGRGITVCERWRNSFEAFYADMGPRPKGLTLDRRENDGNYEPGNCRWVALAVQMANRRRWTWAPRRSLAAIQAEV